MLQSVVESGCSKALEFHQIYMATVTHICTYCLYTTPDLVERPSGDCTQSLYARPSDVGTILFGLRFMPRPNFQEVGSDDHELDSSRQAED